LDGFVRMLLDLKAGTGVLRLDQNGNVDGGDGPKVVIADRFTMTLSRSYA
jgi:hypothetical protein